MATTYQDVWAAAVAAFPRRTFFLLVEAVRHANGAEYTEDLIWRVTVFPEGSTSRCDSKTTGSPEALIRVIEDWSKQQTPAEVGVVDLGTKPIAPDEIAQVQP